MNADNAVLGLSTQPFESELEVINDVDGYTGRDLATEGHLRAMGLWNYLTGAALACLAVVIVVEGLQKPRELIENLVAALVLLLFGAGIATLGYFLRDLSDRVRRTFKILSIIALIFGVIGTLSNMGQALVYERSVAVVLVSGGINLAWTLLVLHTIDSPRAVRICMPGYRLRARARPGPHGFASPFFWGPLGLAGIGVLITVAARAG